MNSACVGGTGERESGRDESRGPVGKTATMDAQPARPVESVIWRILTRINCRESEVVERAIGGINYVRTGKVEVLLPRVGAHRCYPCQLRCVGERRDECVVGHIES